MSSPSTHVAIATPKTRSGYRCIFDPLILISLFIGVVVAIPMVTVIIIALLPAEGVWAHLFATVLPAYLLNTLILMVGVALGVLLIGVGTAWLITMCRFPGRSILSWALVLPLSMPAYVIAYVYTDFLEFSGPLQRLLRVTFHWETVEDYWFPDIRTIGGAITMLTLVLYPYVYLLAKAAFREQSVALLEVSRSLGCSALSSFWKVAIPLARPAIVIGLSLALMETLNDFGTVDYFAVQTLSLGIYKVWLGMNNVTGAAQIATVALLVVTFLIVLERIARRKRRFHHTTSHFYTLPSYELRGAMAICSLLACLFPVALGFLIPTSVLIIYAVSYIETAAFYEFFSLASNSFLLGVTGSLLALIIAIAMVYSLRFRGGVVLGSINRFASSGYAVPGAVLALGVLIPLGWFDNTLDNLSRSFFGIPIGLALSGGVVALIFAYVVRFLAVSYGAVEASSTKINVNLDDAARTLGERPIGILHRVHVPLIKGSILTAVLLVFVEIMKELPMTLILRPFNFDTLSTHVYQYASDEQIEVAAIAALTIVIVGIIPVMLLNYTINKSRAHMS